MPQVLTRYNFTRFDSLVLIVAVSLLLALGLVIWRGDQVGLQVISLSPAADATQVSTRSPIQVTFDQPLQTSADGSPFMITPPLTGSTRWEGSTLFFAPETPLQADTTYRVSLAEDVTAERGRSLPEPVVWQFRTGQPRVLYVAKDQAGHDQLFVINADGSDASQLTHESYGIFDYSLSPDGAQLAYAGLREDGGSDLWKIDLVSRDRSPLLLCPEAVCTGVAWRPQSQSLVYERRVMVVPGAAPGPPRLWWLEVATGQTVAVFDDSQIIGYGAAWSPDGQWLAYIAPSSQGVQVYHVEDGRSVLVPSRLGSAGVWSPQGDSLLVADIQRADEGFSVHLLKARPTGGDLVDITGQGQFVEDTSPAWSPDGAWLVITRKAAGASMGKQLWLLRPDGSEARALTTDTNLHHALPVWSPDGRTIAFQRFALREIDSTPSLGLVELETGEMRNLVPSGNRPAWLP